MGANECLKLRRPTGDLQTWYVRKERVQGGVTLLHHITNAHHWSPPKVSAARLQQEIALDAALLPRHC